MLPLLHSVLGNFFISSAWALEADGRQPQSGTITISELSLFMENCNVRKKLFKKDVSLKNLLAQNFEDDTGREATYTNRMSYFFLRNRVIVSVFLTSQEGRVEDTQ